MALWGNNDNVGSGGLVTLDYSTLVVTGSGTSFGNTGAAKTGDVIRFGFVELAEPILEMRLLLASQVQLN
jgi:hypothetical protein